MTRAILQYKSILGVLKGWKALEACQEVRIMRVKNRFLEPNDTNWADLIVNLVFRDDPAAHVMEVQLCHETMILCRKRLGGHSEYAKYRNCLELKELYAQVWLEDIPVGRLLRTDSYTIG